MRRLDKEVNVREVQIFQIEVCIIKAVHNTIMKGVFLEEAYLMQHTEYKYTS